MAVTVSIVILSFNRKAEVLKTVQLCLNDAYLKANSEVIVVDNCSADGTFEAVTQAYGNTITLLQTEKNIGVAGWNKGFEVATGKYLLVLDDDSHPEAGIAAAVEYLDQHPQVGVLALNITGGAFTTEDYPDRFDWIGFIGCGAIIRKTVFEQIGGFAEWLFIYTHEFEYGIRVIAAGYKIVFFKDATVVHRTSALNRSSQRLVTFSTRNELLIINKYFAQHLSRSLFKGKLKALCYYAEYHGIATVPFVWQGFKEFNKTRNTIAPAKVSAVTQQYFEAQFLPKHSIFTLLTFYLPKSLLKGLMNKTK